MEDNVQLREEEIVGDEVVLSDIYPKTNTSSVIDDISGTTLNETLDRIQEKINNKLSRVVNSVNGRTGVVVLDSEDVGLGNVDNVSFSDIKGWVINLLVSEFANKRIALLNSLDEAEAIASENQEANRDRPFFSETGYHTLKDKKSYIGYFYYDESTKELKVVSKPLNTIGQTDESLRYETDIGRLSVIIRDGEKALNVNHDPRDPGLYIDKSEIMPTIRYFDGVWGRVDTDYTPDEVRGEIPLFSDPSSEYKYRIAMKGFCPSIDTQLEATTCQHIVMRFHTDRYNEVGKYEGNTVGEGYYVGDRTFDQREDGRINFKHPKGVDDFPYSTPDYSPNVVLYGERPQGIYKVATREKERSSGGQYHTLKSVEYILLRTNQGMLHPNEVIYCAFRPPVNNEGEYVIDRNTGERYHPQGIDTETLDFLTNRQPAFGIVRKYLDTDPKRLVVVDFYDHEIQPGWSLEYSIPGSINSGNKSLEVEVSRAKVAIRGNGDRDTWNNLSGLQTISPQGINVDDVLAGVSDHYELLTDKPSDWENNWLDYYTKNLVDGTYTQLTRSSDYEKKVTQYNRTKLYTKFVLDHPPTDVEKLEIENYIKNGHTSISTKLGDVNLDNIITNADADYVLGYAAEQGIGHDYPMTDQQRTNADVDKNGIINADDARIILQMVDNNDGSVVDYPSYITHWVKVVTSGGFKEKAPYNRFKEEPRYYKVEYVWGGKDISDIGYIDETLRDQNSWMNIIGELLMYTVYYMNLNPEDPDHPYIDDQEYDELRKPIEFEKDTYYRKIVALLERQRYVMLPSGPTRVYDAEGIRTGGMFINPDASMCVIPKQLCFNSSGHVSTDLIESLPEILTNWRPTLPKTRYSNQDDNIRNLDISDGTDVISAESSTKSNAVKDYDCYVGINLMKGLKWMPGSDAYEILESEPLDWSTNYMNYYKHSSIDDAWIHVEGIIPDGSTDPVAPEWKASTYYEMRENRQKPEHLTYDKYYSYNASGLRVIGNYDDFDQDKVDYSWFGMNYGEYEDRYHLDLSRERNLDMNIDKGIMHSGGVSVNIGKFLEIDPGTYTEVYADWYDGGKVNVRIGKGLEEEPITTDSKGRQLTGNRIQLAIDSNSGFKFDTDGKLSMKPMISAISRLDFVDTYNTHFLYDPLPSYLFTNDISYNDIVFQLGKGLKLITDETRARDFDKLMDALTVVQLEIFLDCADETIYSITSKIAKRKALSKKNDYALEADTEAINKVIVYHPSRDHGLPYYTMSLSNMIKWAIENEVEGVSSDDRGPTSSDSIPMSVNEMTLRNLKDRVAYRYITMENQSAPTKIGEYKDETLKMITPFTEENTTPISIMMTYYGWTDLEENIYNSLMYKANKKLLQMREILDYYATYDYFNTPDRYYEYGTDSEGNPIRYTDPVTLALAVCSDARTDLTKAAMNPKSFTEVLSDDENIHIMADSCGELWTGIVEKCGYTTAQEWLDDKSIGLTRDIIKQSIDNLASVGSEYDYGWSKRAAIFKERLSEESVQTVVTLRNAGTGTQVHKVSIAFLKKVVESTPTVSPTDISRTTYVEQLTQPDDWESNWQNYCVKYIPAKSYEPYEANKYYKAFPVSGTYVLLSENPGNWDKSYFKYYQYTGGVYKHIPKTSTPPEFVNDKYYKMAEVSFTKLTSASFEDTTYIGTGNDYTVYPPTKTEWTGRTTESSSTTAKTGNVTTLTGASYDAYLNYVASHYTGTATTLDEAELKRAGLLTYSEWVASYYKTSVYESTVFTTKTGTTYKTNDTKIIGYTPVQEVYIKMDDGTDAVIKTGGDAIYGTSTTSGSSSATDISSSADSTAKVKYWSSVWMQYWVEATQPYPTLKEAGYDGTSAPLFVKGMFYKKNVDTTPRMVYTTDDILSPEILQADSYKKLTKTIDGSIPEWKTNTYYAETDSLEYDELYDEPSDWKTMDWSTNTKYYNYQHTLLTTNPGQFIPRLYYTKSPNTTKYVLLGTQPVDWAMNPESDTPGYTKYYRRENGTQVKIRDDITNATWLETGNRVTENEKYESWIVTNVDTNAHAGLDGFKGEDLNTLMLYVLGRRWSIREMLSRTSSESPWITWTKDIEDEE